MSEQLAIVVEDEQDAAELITATLLHAGIEVHQVTTGDEVLVLLPELEPDLVTLDLGLPGMDGLETCRRIRDMSDCYVMVITASHAEIDHLVSLAAGADDVMSKPFSPRELRARVDALFRRPRSTTALEGAQQVTAGRIEAGGGLVVDLSRHEVMVGDQLISLTRTEFNLLSHLAAKAGMVCSRSEIIWSVWESDYYHNDHTLDVHLGNLRRKLRTKSAHSWITTVRGVGFRFDSLAS